MLCLLPNGAVAAGTTNPLIFAIVNDQENVLAVLVMKSTMPACAAVFAITRQSWPG